jgi:hypothetical protein
VDLSRRHALSIGNFVGAKRFLIDQEMLNRLSPSGRPHDRIIRRTDAREKNVKTFALVASIAGLVLAASTANAAPSPKANPNAGTQGCGASSPGANQDALIFYYTVVEPTGSPTPGGVVDSLGGAISGGFYGNTSNSGVSPYAPANGHGVTPSISPGPQTVGGGGPGTGTSIGDFIQLVCH